MDLEQRQNAPLIVGKYKKEFQQYNQTLNPAEKSYHDFYSQMVRNLIAIGHDLKNKESSQNFFRNAHIALPQVQSREGGYTASEFVDLQNHSNAGLQQRKRRV